MKSDNGHYGLKNSLISDESKDGFCFRSSCSQNLSQKKLADWQINLLFLKAYLSAEDMGSVGVPREKKRAK